MKRNLIYSKQTQFPTKTENPNKKHCISYRFIIQKSLIVFSHVQTPVFPVQALISQQTKYARLLVERDKSFFPPN